MILSEARRRVGSRGAVLLILAVIDFGIGLSWIFPTPEQSRAQSTLWREELAPSWVWGSLWLIVSVCCVIGAITRSHYIGFGAAVALKMLWATFEFGGWQAGAITQGYRPGLIWVGYAALIAACAVLHEPRPYRPPAPDEGGDRSERG